MAAREIMTEKILILGAGISYTNLFRAANETNKKIIATDKNPDAPGFELADESEPVDITDTEKTLHVAEKYDIDGIIPINDYGVKTAAKVANEFELPGIEPGVAEICTDKAKMRKVWEKADIPQPEFSIIETLGEAKEIVETVELPLILKPANSIGGGSRGVYLLKDRENLKKAFEFAQSAYPDDDRILIEESVMGTEHSIELIIQNGNPHVLAVSDKEKTPPPYRVDKSIIYPSESPILKKITEVAKKAVTALNIDIGAAHVELGVENGVPKLFELGARCGGGAIPNPIVPAVTGVDYFKELIRIYTGNKPNSLVPKKSDGVTYRFLTPDPGHLEAIFGVDKVRSWDGILSCEAWVAPGETIEDIRVGRDRSGAVVAHASTRGAAYRLARQAEEHIKFQISPHG